MSVLAIVLFAAAMAAAEPTRHVTGVVVDASSHTPIFGAVIAEPAGKRLAVTDRKGRFEVTAVRLPPSLRVTAPHLAPRLVDIPAAGANLELGRVLLWRTGRMKFLLTSPVSARHLRWSCGTIEPGGKSVEKKREGTLPDAKTDLVFDALEPAQYVVTFMGERPLQRYSMPVAMQAGADLAVPVTIAPAIVDLEVLKGEKPLSGAIVGFRNVDSLWRTEVHCDDRGRASEELWQPGKFTVWVLSKGIETHGEFRTFPEGEAHIQVEIRVPPHTIHGRVVDASTGAALTDVNVVINMKSGGRRTQTDRAGNFEFEAVPEGEHVIHAYRKGYRYDQPSEVVIRADDEDVDHTVSLEPLSGQRHVRVADVAGRAVVGASTFFGSGAQANPLEATDENGNVDVPPGSGTLFVVPRGGSFAFRSIQADDVDAIAVTVPPPVGLLTIVSQSTRRNPIPYVIFMLRVNGTLIPPAVVSRLATTQNLPFRTDADGRAQLTGLPPGLYDIWPARTRSDLDAIFSGNPAAPAATVPVSSVPQLVTLTFEPVH